MKIRTRLSVALAAALLVGVSAITLTWAPSPSHAQEHEHGDVLYQCPMHPQIISDGEGRCPLCKMFLKQRPAGEAMKKLKSWEEKTGKKAPPMLSGRAPAPASQPNAKAVPAPKSKAKSGQTKASTAPSTSTGTSTKPRVAKRVGAGDYTCPMHTHIAKTKAGQDEELRCPVCGMHLVPRDQLQEHEGHAHDHDTYVCPMHPQVVTDEPGRCPICGMDLEEKDTGAASNAPAKKTRTVKHWVAPMDPTFISDKPGKSPMGMDLVPVYEDDGANGPVVKIDPVVVQNMGVRIAKATREPLFRHIRALGTVDVAEDEIAVVNLRFSGWIEQLYVDETGVKVKPGQWLAEVYSPELVSAQEEYLLALRTGGTGSPLAKSARRRLEFFGMSPSDIDRVDATKQTLRTIRVRAPREGYVLHKNVVQGARVMAGMDIFRIGNLQKIWINAEVYEFDAPWVELGAPATMELTYQQGKTYSGKVAYIYPTLNEKSRTLSVRLEFDNPGLALKPGMFATVRIEARRRNGALAIPTEAILHSGERQLVFVALGGGRYEKRELVTGLVADRHLTEVQSGVREGERVVVSGQFLLDSESQLQEAVQKLLDARLEAKSPGFAQATSDEGSSEADTYWTCGMHPQIVQSGPGSCPICGMDLVEKRR